MVNYLYLQKKLNLDEKEKEALPFHFLGQF
jgi:hypothetical protein